MCIISLKRDKDHQMILTHNRDEDKNRPSSEILITKIIEGKEVTYPEDRVSGGTWILTSELWTTAILNGAKFFHQRNPPYLHSRGVFPLELMKFTDLFQYFENLNLENIEPFTQIILNNVPLDFYEIIWDGESKTINEVQTDFYVNCSSTLYSAEKKMKVQSAFYALENPNADKLAELHEALKWEFNPEVPMVETTSITQIQIKRGEKCMNFKNRHPFLQNR